MRTVRSIIFSLLLGSSLTSCISVQLGSNDVQRAKGIEFTPPPEPFAAFEPGRVDAAWKHSKNGNSISYLSDCTESTDPTLLQIQEGILYGITEQEVLSSENLTYNGRAALRTTAKGQVDGVPSRVDLMVFKKNHCIYVLTYVALPESYEENLDEFNQFLDGFRAP